MDHALAVCPCNPRIRRKMLTDILYNFGTNVYLYFVRLQMRDLVNILLGNISADPYKDLDNSGILGMRKIMLIAVSHLWSKYHEMNEVCSMSL